MFWTEKNVQCNRRVVVSDVTQHRKGTVALYKAFLWPTKHFVPKSSC